MQRFILFFIYNVIVTLSCDAQTSWIQPVSGNWFVGSNWSPAVVPSNAVIAQVKNGASVTIAQPGALANTLFLGPGSLILQDGGTLTTGYGYINGPLLVTGAGSAINSLYPLTIGYTASGSIVIKDGAKVSTGSGGLGYIQNGTVTGLITDEGSTWTVGGFGTGYGSTLTVSNGGDIVNTSTFGVSGANVLVTGSGSSISNAGMFNVQGGTNGVVTVQLGAVISSAGISMDGSVSSEVVVTDSGSAWISSGPLTVYNGTLRVKNGSSLNTASVSIDNLNDSIGSVIVDGKLSTMTVDQMLFVKGKFAVLNGASVHSGSGRLFSTPVVTIDGSGSAWINAGDFEIQGTLSVTNGARVKNANSFISPHYGGSVTIDGAGSEWASTGDLKIGTQVAGSLTVQGGAQVSNNNAYLGFYGSGTSTALIKGQGSIWNNLGSLYVGYYSSSVPGIVTVEDGATLQVDGGVAGAKDGIIYLSYGSNTSGTLNIGGVSTGGVVKAATVAFGPGTDNLIFKHTDPSYSFLPVITGSGAIQHINTGKTILLGNSPSFIGSIAVTAGTLLVRNSLGSASTPIVISSGATLGGSGSVRQLTLNSGGYISPGGDEGDSSLDASSLSWTGGGVMKFDLGNPTASDKLILSGALTKGSGSGFVFQFSCTPSYMGPATYDLIKFGSTSFTAGNFSTSGPVTGTFQIVNNTLRFTANPTVPTAVSQATGTPLTLTTGDTAALSALAADTYGGEANITYTWSATGPSPVSFSKNKSNAAKNTVATFNKAGVYNFQIAMTNAAGLGTTSSTVVIVNQKFAWWAAENGFIGDDALPLASPRANGVSNLVAYAFDIAAELAPTSGFPATSISSGNLILTYIHPRADIDYRTEWSTDLSTWYGTGVTVTDSGLLRNASVPVGTDSRKFMRVKLSLLP